MEWVNLEVSKPCLHDRFFGHVRLLLCYIDRAHKLLTMRFDHSTNVVSQLVRFVLHLFRTSLRMIMLLA